VLLRWKRHPPRVTDAAKPRRDLAFWYATWFGSGLFPTAPGTVGTIACLPLWGALLYFEVPWWGRLGLAFALFFVGIPAATRTAENLGKDDPKEVVIDEVAGQGVAIAFAATTWPALIVGFALFRLFDITKPPPVGWADKKLHGGLGIMLDDMLAGGMAAAGLYAFERWAWPPIAAAIGA
jgi:phosphatidylglycerophosphatase A